MQKIVSKNLAKNPENTWSVYIIETSDDLFYTGITTNILRRWKQHCGAPGGARFFRGRKPSRLMYLENDHNRSSASKRESAIKKLSRKEKEKLLHADENQLKTPVNLSYPIDE